MLDATTVVLAPGLRYSEDKAAEAAEALYRSTLGTIPRGSFSAGSALHGPRLDDLPMRPETAQARHCVRFADEADLERDFDFEDDFEDTDAVEKVMMRRAARHIRVLDRQLYIYSAISAIMTIVCLLQLRNIDPVSFSAISNAAHWLELLPPAPAIVLASYVSLLLTFRTGVRRIAFSMGPGEDESSQSSPDRFVAGESYARQLSLEGGRGVLIQGLTLLSATALLHIPVCALQQLSAEVGLTGWFLSTTLAGLVIWDAILSSRQCVVDDDEIDDARDFCPEKEALLQRENRV